MGDWYLFGEEGFDGFCVVLDFELGEFGVL